MWPVSYTYSFMSPERRRVIRTRRVIKPPRESSVTRFLNNVNRELDMPMVPMSRRAFIGSLLTAAGAGAVVEYLREQYFTRNNIDEEDTVPVIREPFDEPFQGQEANEAAKKLGITAGTFFKVPEKLVDRLTAFLDDELYPIYPPAVLVRKGLIYSLPLKPNIPAGIMAVESAGKANAVSNAGAQGLFQVMPFHFEADGISDQTQMRLPEVNAKYGVRVFQDFFNNSSHFYSGRGYPENHPLIYIRALMGYNGGWDAVTLPIVPDPQIRRPSAPLSPEESSFYGDYLIRYFITAEIASLLRKNWKLTDPEIVRQLKSMEVEARAYSLSKFRQESRFYDFQTYSEACLYLSQKEPWSYTKSKALSRRGREILKEGYDEYFQNPSLQLPYPASPGLAIWLYLGGRSLFEQEPINTDLNAWKNINSRR